MSYYCVLITTPENACVFFVAETRGAYIVCTERQIQNVQSLKLNNSALRSVRGVSVVSFLNQLDPSMFSRERERERERELAKRLNKTC